MLAALSAVPLLLVVAAGGLAAALPEDVLWLNAARATLLTLTRWLALTWLVPAALAAWRRRPGAALGLAALAVVGAGVPPLDEVEGPGLVVVAANAQAYADDAAAFERDLAALGADLILTHERRGERVEGMRRVAHNDDRPLPRPSHGAAVYCREGLACEARITDHVGPEGCAMPMALARVEGRLCVIGVHAPPPVPVCAEGLTPYVEAVAAMIEGGRVTRPGAPCQAGDPALVMGDLNYVPGSHVHRRLLASGLRDPGRWLGVWGGTWPAGGGWPDLPFFRLDHALGGDLALEGLRHVRLSGSDHLAPRVRVRLREDVP